MTATVANLQWTFSIGGIVLDRFEVPAEFQIGFEKNLVVHKFISQDGTSQLTTHNNGTYPIPTHWSGTLFYADALTRFQQIEALVTNLEAITFQYGPLSYLVDVQKVAGTVRHQLEIDYEIDLIVLQAQTAVIPISGSLPIQGALVAEELYTNGTTTWTNFSSMTTINPALTRAYNDMQDLIQNAVPLSQASFAQLNAAFNATNEFLAILAPLIAQLQNAVINELGTNTLLMGMSAQANFTQFAGYLGGLVSSNAGSTTIQVQDNTSLFTLAQQFYPQAPTQDAATLIQQANGLIDFYTDGPMTLAIPPLRSGSVSTA